MKVEFKEIYNMLDDGSMIGVNFSIEEDYNDLLTISGDDESLVEVLNNEVYEHCNNELHKEGYKIVDSFIYFNKDNSILTFEIERLSK